MARQVSFGGGLVDAPEPRYMRQRAMADALMSQNAPRISGWGEGVANLARTAAAGFLNRRAEDTQKSEAVARAETLQKALSSGDASAALEALGSSEDPQLQGMALNYRMAQLLDPQSQDLKQVWDQSANGGKGGMVYVNESDAVGQLAEAPQMPSMDAPEVKDFYEGGQVVQKQWDQNAGQWTEVGRGARWQPQQQGEAKVPGIVTLTNEKGEVVSLRDNDPRIDQYLASGFYEGKPQVTPDTTKLPNILRDEFNSLTKDFRTVQDAYSKIESTSETGAGDMSMLYSYVKLLDPGSVVRESEFATAAASGSFGEQVQGAVQRILTGERLPPDLRKSFKDEAKRIYGAQKQGYDRVTQIYTGMANRANINPQDVIVDYAAPVDLGTDTPPNEGGAPDERGGVVIDGITIRKKVQ